MHTTATAPTAPRIRPAFRVQVGDVIVIDRVRVRVTSITPVVRFGTRTRPVAEVDRIRLRISGRPVAARARGFREVTLGNYDKVRIVSAA